MLDYLAESNIDTDIWLASVNLNAATLSDGSTQIPLQSWLTLLETAVTETKRPDLGVIIGERLGLQHHGALGLAITNCEKFDDLITILCTYIATRNPLIRIVRRDHPNARGLSIQECVDLGPIKPQIIELVIASLYNVLSQLFPGEDVFERVQLDYSTPLHQEKLQRLWHCDVMCEQAETEIAFSPALVGKSIPGRDSHMLTIARQVCDAELQNVAPVASLHSRVRHHIIDTGVPFPSLEQTAQRFAMTSRTLHRKLLDEGCHFRQIVQEVRQDWARNALVEQRMDVNSVASLLGYSDTANFRRAFKQWFGCTPAQMKKEEG